MYTICIEKYKRITLQNYNIIYYPSNLTMLTTKIVVKDLINVINTLPKIHIG